MDGMYDTFHAGDELDDDLAEEKAAYHAWLREYVGGSSTASKGRWDGGVHVLSLRSHRTGANWEIKSVSKGSGLVPVSAAWTTARGPSHSPSMKRAYRLLEDHHTLRPVSEVTGRAYLELCETQLPVLAAHPSNHAHLAGAAGVNLRELLRQVGPENAAFVTHLLDAVPVEMFSGFLLDPLAYREQALRGLAAALEGYVFFVAGFDEVVLRTFDPAVTRKKSTQFIYDHIAAKPSYGDVPLDRPTRWSVPHTHEVIVAIHPSGRVLGFDQLRRLLAPLRGHRHAVQVLPLVGGRGKKASGSAAPSKILDYSNKRLGQLSNGEFFHLVDWHARAPNSGIFDCFVDATEGRSLSPVISTLVEKRYDMHRLTKTDTLHKLGLGSIDDHIEWFKSRLPLSYK